MALLAISITRSNGIYDLALPNGRYYALIFLILVHATLGPLFATPGQPLFLMKSALPLIYLSQLILGDY